MMNSKDEPMQPKKKPDDTGGFLFSSGVKIFDPNTNEVLLNKRGDD